MQRLESRQMLAADLLAHSFDQLVPEGEGTAIARFSHQFLDSQLQTLPSNEVQVGDRFYLRTFVQDTRGEASQGINAAYLDLAFDNDAIFDISVGEIQSLSFFTDELDLTQADSRFLLQFQSDTSVPIELLANGEVRSAEELADAIHEALKSMPSIGEHNVYASVDDVANRQDQLAGIPRLNFEIRFRSALAEQNLPSIMLDTSNVAVNSGASFEFEIVERVAGDQDSLEAKTASVLFDGDAQFARRVELAERIFNDIGATDGNLPVTNSSSPKLLFTIPLVATQAGVSNFSPASGDNAPMTDVISGINVIPPSQVDFGGAFSLAVVGPPTGMALNNAAVDENLSAGAIVGVFSTTPDIGEEYTYSLVEGEGDTDNTLFTIEGNTLKTAASFDFETQSMRSVRVETMDSRGFKFARAFEIEVTDVNETPVDISISNRSVLENQPIGSLVGEFSTVDPDFVDEHVYSLLGDEASLAAFEVSGNRLLSTQVFDFETQSEFNLTVRATDKGGLTVDKPFVITVVNANDAPNSIVLGNDQVEEELPVGSLVGELQAEDQDVGDELTFLLVEGEGGEDNSLFRIESNTLVTNGRLNFEAVSSLSVRIRVEDLAGAAEERVFGISVLDVEENDVNGDSFVSPIDALLVINFLNSSDDGTLGEGDSRGLDVNGDGLVTPIDALLVINHLNNNAGGEGEWNARDSELLAATNPAAYSIPSMEELKLRKGLGSYFQ